MQGVIAAVPTPIGADRFADKTLFVEHCSWALDNGCDGLNILGSTGEANSFDSAARREVMSWAARALPTEKLMVGTATPSLAETIALTEYADELGYRVALVLPPYYYKPASEAGLVAWYMALHDALGDRSLQIYFYNYPQMTGLTIPVRVISELIRRAPARFTGIKDSSGDLDYCRALIAENDQLRVFPSSETTLENAHTDGFAGCISATTNVTGALAAQIWSQRTAPPREICETVARLRAAIAGPSLIASIKVLVADRTGNAAWRAVLPPFTALTDQEADALRTKLADSAHGG